jgi:CHAT domain-containing protein
LGAVDLLYLVPIGGLHGVPWHAVTVDGKPAIERCPIAYAPSPAAAVRLAAPQRPAPVAGADALVVGDPTGNLRHARAEAEEIATAIRATALIDDQATVTEVQKRLRLAPWAHFAAHGGYRHQDPMGSGVDLADGRLEARALLRGSAPRVVVVSARESGRQAVASADELWGLGRALLSAGSATAVLSQWRVADSTTAELMLSFYRHLQQASAPQNEPRLAQALRRAMLDLRQSHPQTFYWAPFALVGNSW